MIPISDRERALYNADNKQVLRMTGTDGNGQPITITDANVMMGGFNIDRYCCNGSKIEMGTAIASEMTVKLDNRTGRYNSVPFEGAELSVEIGVADWLAMDTAKNLFTGTLNPVVTPEASRPRLLEQSVNTTMRGDAVVTEHGIGAVLTNGAYPYIRFGTNMASSGTMNGLEAGQTYTWSFDYALKLFSGPATGTSQNVLAMLYWAVSGTNAFTSDSDHRTTIATYEASEYGTIKTGHTNFTFTIPSTAVACYLIVTTHNGSAWHASGDYIKLSNLMLVQGSRASVWTPAQDEVDDVYYMPCGKYIVDEQPTNASVMTLTALDRMTLFDKAIGTLTLPSTVANLVSQCCSACNVTLAASITSLPNANIQISALPETTDTISYRMLIMWAAGVMGTNAYMDWNGELRFGWYNATSGYVSTSANRFGSDVYGDDIAVTGFEYTGTDNTVYIAGEDDYTIDLTNNPLVNDSNAMTILSAIYAARRGFTYRPYNATAIYAPYLMPMDSIVFTDIDGNTHSTTLTNVNLTLNGSTKLSAVGETYEVNDRLSPGSFTPGQEQAIRKIQKVNDQRMDTAIENATAQITGADGGYVRMIYDSNNKLTEIVIMDTEDITTATKVWRWNSGGLGYSSNGYNGPYTLAMTQDGAIVADFITTGTLDGTKINAKLLNIVDANGDVIASFSDMILLGKSGEARTELDFNSFEITDMDGETILRLGDMRDANGECSITDTFTGDGTNEFDVSYAPYSMTKVTINGVETQAYTVYAGSTLVFDTVPPSGSVIVVQYVTKSKIYYYNLGIRADGHIPGHLSLVEGDNNTAIGVASHAEGSNTKALGGEAHAEGAYTESSSYASHAEGVWTKASNVGAHAEGYYTNAYGFASHAEGYFTNAAGNYQHVFGKYNVSDFDNYAEIVGNGTGESYRSNARTLDWNGNEYIAGALSVGDAATTRANIGAVSSDVTDGISERLDGLNTSARNLIVKTLNPVANPRESRPSIKGATTVGAGVAGTCTVAEHGVRSTVTSAAYPYILFGTGSTSVTSLQGLEAGKTYTLSFDYDVKLYGGSPTGTRNFGAYLYVLTTGGSAFAIAESIILETFESGHYTENRTGHCAFTFTVPANAASIYIQIRGNITATYYASGDYIEAANLMLVNANMPAQWLAAPEDLAPKSDISTTFTTNDGKTVTVVNGVITNIS